MYDKLLNFMKRNINRMFLVSEGNYFVYRCRDYTSSDIIRKIIQLIAAPFYVIKYFLPFRLSAKKREGLAFVLIAKNEAPYIKEWIDFHVKQGVSHFIIYDNESTDNFHEVLMPYINSGLVTYQIIKGKKRQNDVYNMAIIDYRKRFRYMAMIDADEFLFVRNNRVGGVSLYEFVDKFMNSHPNAGGLAVNWCIFGSGGHITKPEGGVLENFTMRSEKDFSINHIIKTICDPMKVFSWINAHFPLYYRGFSNLDENGNAVTRASSASVNFETIRINHYFVKSREEFIAKRNRGMADCLGLRSMSEFDWHDKNEYTDTEILSHI